MQQQTNVIPNPADRLAMFRVGRLGESIDCISASTRAFRAEVEKTLDEKRPDSVSGKALASAFVAAYRDLTGALEAAKAGRHVEGPTLDVLTGIMDNLRVQYATGVSELRDSVGQLNEGSTAFAEFNKAALEKVERLDQFYREVYKPLAPAWKPKI